MLNQRIVEKKTFAGLLLKSDTLLISVVYSSLTWQSEIELNMLFMLNISVSYFPNKTTHCPWMITALQKQAILQPWGSWSFRDVSTPHQPRRPAGGRCRELRPALSLADASPSRSSAAPVPTRCGSTSCPAALCCLRPGVPGRPATGVTQERAESRPRPHPGACERGPPGPGQLGRSVLKVTKPPALSWVFLAHLRKSARSPWVVSSGCTGLAFSFLFTFLFLRRN